MRKFLGILAVCAATLVPAAALAAPALKYHDAAGLERATVTCTVFWVFRSDHSGQAGQHPQAHISNTITKMVCLDHHTYRDPAHDEMTCAYTGRLFFYKKQNGNAIMTVRGRVTQARCPVVLPLHETAWIVQAGMWINFGHGYRYTQDYCNTRVPETRITRKCGP